jgi:hypothetical protein
MLSWDSGFILKSNKTQLNKTRYCQPCFVVVIIVILSYHNVKKTKCTSDVHEHVHL